MRLTTERRRSGWSRTSPSKAVIESAAAAIAPARVRAIGAGVERLGVERSVSPATEVVSAARGVDLGEAMREPIAIPTPTSTTAAAAHARGRLELRLSGAIAR